MAPDSPLRRLGQVAINVREIARATEFYREVLGLPLLFSAGTMAFFDLGGTRLMLSPPERPEDDHLSSILYFDVADIAATHGRLAALGVRFEGEPHVVAKLAASEVWMAFFRDSEGNLLALQSEVTRPA